MKNKFFLILIIVLASCSQQNPIEQALETKSDEYWCYYRQKDSYFTYFKFDENKLSYRYNRDGNHFTDESEDSFMKEEPLEWSVSEDSIMRWGNFAYDVVSYSDKAIVISYPTKEAPYLNFIFFIKEKESDYKKYPNDYDEKRLYNPEKYKVKN